MTAHGGKISVNMGTFLCRGPLCAICLRALVQIVCILGDHVHGSPDLKMGLHADIRHHAQNSRDIPAG